MSTSWCAPLRTVSAADLATAGGKGANLGELVRAGFRVPAGFVVTTQAYRAAVAGLAADLVPTRASVLDVEVPPEVREAVLVSYAELGGGPVAVRSSATAEDLPGAAFAGQQDSFLGVVGEVELIDALRRCWASLWTERAVAYRRRLGVDEANVAVGVVVQRLVPAEHAGVMFTANPVTGARDQVVIDSSPGLGEAVVGGLVTPDHAVLDAAGQIVERARGRRETVITASARGGTRVLSGEDVPSDLDSVGDADLARIAAQGRRIAAHFGRPQDIEWALAGGGLEILQARPMTALPPRPVPLTRLQRFIGPVILEMLPRRPYPMELTAWDLPILGSLVEGMVSGMAGATLQFDDVISAEDAVVHSFVPPRFRPTVRTPARVARSVGRAGRDPRGWADDPLQQRYLVQASRLRATDVTTVTWAELVEIPTAARRVMDLLTRLRVAYLPSAGGALARLRLLVTALGEPDLLKDLIVDAPTLTREANAALADLAQQVREDEPLSRAFAKLSGEDLRCFVQTDPAAADLRQRLATFLARFGHRESTSILLLRDPTWADSPQTVLSIVRLLVEQGGNGQWGHEPIGTKPPASVSQAALDRLLAHPVAHRLERPIQRLVAKAAAGIALREDTHYETTRLMPVVRRAVVEAGRRLATAGALHGPEDVWYLTWDEVKSLPDPTLERAGAERDAGAGRGPGSELTATVQRRRAAYAELASSPLIATATLYPDRAIPANALLSGVGGGGGRASGPVRVVLSPDEFGLVRTGDVLVCPSTNPSWTPLFARVAAVVVDHGGLASHAAIVAREYGIPAVMGTADGTTALRPGRRVTVDGDRGAVTLADGGEDGNG